MKVYVDEMPKSCKTCPFQCYGECKCGADILNVDYSKLQCHLKKSRSGDCPLHRLCNYDKQLRNDLIDEIKQKLDKSKLQIVGEDNYSYTNNFLDQMRGENNGRK